MLTRVLCLEAAGFLCWGLLIAVGISTGFSPFTAFLAGPFAIGGIAFFVWASVLAVGALKNDGTKTPRKWPLYVVISTNLLVGLTCLIGGLLDRVLRP